MAGDILLVSSCWVCRLCALPALCLPPAELAEVGHSRKKRKPGHCASSVQEQPKYCRVINTVLPTDSKCSIIQAAPMKVNSTLDRYSVIILTHKSYSIIQLLFIKSEIQVFHQKSIWPDKKKLGFFFSSSHEKFKLGGY